MSEIKTETFQLPAQTACFFYYGDEDGYNEDDLEILNKFVDDNLKQHEMFHILSSKEDTSFMAYHDLQSYGWLADECVEMTFQVG